MLLLAFDAMLLIFTSAGAGIFMITCTGRIFGKKVYANPLGIILAGIVFLTLYFNLVSFLQPVNYYSLLPPVLLSIIMFARRKAALLFTGRVQQAAAFLFSRPNIFVTIPVCMMLAFCWLMPPVNADGAGYHYSTVLWFETYKVVPGLANVDGRLAYNSAAFIIEAAFGFTRIAGQSLYPLNGVLTILFFSWLLKKILQSRSTVQGIVYFLLLYLLNRVLLVNMPSATADTLVLICLSYSFIQVFEALLARQDVTYFLLPLVLLLYAVTAKLSAYPGLLLFIVVLVYLKQDTYNFRLLAGLCLMAFFIYVPWLCRNVILSGYLLYPVPFIDIFNVDWKAPKDILLLDYIYIKRLPVNFDDALVRVTPPPFPQWIWPWVQKQLHNGMRTELFILFGALLSPLSWIIAVVKKVNVTRVILYVWLVLYLCVVIWLINVPEYRFGIVFMSFAIALPWLYYAIRRPKKNVYSTALFITLFIIESAWYIYSSPGARHIQGFAFGRFLVYPLKDRHYYFDNDTAGIHYTMLNNNIKLYHQDSAHNCINAALPCMIYKYGIIELRGKSIADGFRNVQDDVSRNYPFVK
ncbi:MAG TPA: hypothetical protein VHB48_02015 [Chitinophagaceae bacterium]|nr:hypothetical protein [Chitinophagaceae bacterium]